MIWRHFSTGRAGTRRLRWLALGASLGLALGAAACAATGDDRPVLYISGIPDQDNAVLEENFRLLAEYLTDRTDLPVRYIPTIDYVAVVTGFRHGDLHLAWFGGLTGVQARLVTPGAEAILQRPVDASFYAVFIARKDAGIASLADVRGRRLTFGSESSTSGHLMPRSYLMDAGIDPDRDLNGPPNYSGSHDTTIRLVETGAFDVAALNEPIWDARVAEGLVDTTVVQVFHRAGPYYNYHWVIRGDVDERFGAGAAARLQTALLNLHEDTADPRAARILAFFTTDRFIPTANANYDGLARTAQSLGLIDP